MKGYSTREIAELLDIPEASIRQYARSGIVNPARGPKNTYEFQFRDLVVLRTARALGETGIRRGKVLRVLQVLKDSLRDKRPLTSLRMEGTGSEVVVQDQDQLINPESGQVHMDFDQALDKAEVASMPYRPGMAIEGMTSDDWFDMAIDLEKASPADALDAYRRALALNGEHVDAHINMGRLLQEASELQEATRHYEEALRLDPDNLLAAFNLGTLYEETGQIRQAIQAYKMAASLADSHYNLFRLYEQLEQPANALLHLKAYLAMVEDSAST